MTLPANKLFTLIVLDGWGISSPGPGNAVELANTPNMDKFMSSYPNTLLEASGEAVGLPRGEAGNTETGHLNIGAGKIVYQDLERINMAIADGTFYQNQALLSAFEHVRKFNSKLHFMGLIGAGGVHSNIEHLFALLNLAKMQNYPNVYLHLFTDGRDSPPTSSKSYIKRIKEDIEAEKVGIIASVMGRYWAMDRDRRWDRTAKAYNCLTLGEGNLVKTPEEAVDLSYDQGKTDEFVEPSLVCDQNKKPLALIGDNDAVIFFNFRIDRPRQLTAAFVVKDFDDQSVALEFDPYLERYEKTHIISKVALYQQVFARKKYLNNLFFVTMTEYSQSLIDAGIKVAIHPERIEYPISRVISENNLTQLKVSESEKERFITYYFNGLKEEPFPNEEKMIIPSPNVATYDQMPQMSCEELAKKVIEKINTQKYAFVVINFANPDMVGHTGNIGPAVKACEYVDTALGEIVNQVLTLGGEVIVTADHGNAEEMINNHTGQIDTEHNANRVPFIYISSSVLGKNIKLSPGILADIAPTILKRFNIEKPAQMTGRDLLEESKTPTV